MASFQFKPNARPFVPRGTSTMGLPPTTPGTPGSNSEKPCQAILHYHSCLCRTPIPTWICGQPQSQCSHQSVSLVVSALPFACCSPMNVGARAVNKKQRPSSQGAEESCRTEACRAADPANQQYVSDADAAQALQQQQLVKLDAFPGLGAKNIDEVVPAFLEEGKNYPDEVRARYQALRTSLGIKDEEEKNATTTTTASSPEGTSATADSYQSDSEDSDETLENSDSDSDPGFNSDSDDDEPITPPTDPAKLKFLNGLFAFKPIAPPASRAEITSTSTYESDSDSDYDSDDEEEDSTVEKKKKKNKYSLKSLVEESEPSL
ncbi:hypothetical protein PG984_009582 [Apiospora sp. TS-2023a]